MNSFSCFHWIPDHQALIANIHRVLRGRGRFRGLWHGATSMSELVDSFEAAMAAPQWAPHFARRPFSNPFTLHTAGAWTAMAKAAGFRVVDVKVGRDLTTHTWDELTLRIMAGWVPFFEAVPTDNGQRAAFIGDVVQRYFGAEQSDPKRPKTATIRNELFNVTLAL